MPGRFRGLVARGTHDDRLGLQVSPLQRPVEDERRRTFPDLDTPLERRVVEPDDPQPVHTGWQEDLVATVGITRRAAPELRHFDHRSCERGAVIAAHAPTDAHPLATTMPRREGSLRP